MIYFPELRTRRLTIRLREISILDAVTIAAMPTGMEQAETTALLRAAVESVSDGSDPLEWTFEERTLAFCHYLAATNDDGPDFAVGDYHYTDYVDMGKQLGTLKPIALGEIAGDKWTMCPLTGRHAEAIERLEGELQGANGAPIPALLHWHTGAMACQLLREGEDQPLDAGQVFDEWLLERMKTFLALPESDYSALLLKRTEGAAKLAHLFYPVFSKKGIVFNPVEGAGDDIPPARFPPSTCLTQIPLAMA